jgi:hypothetical protein
MHSPKVARRDRLVYQPKQDGNNTFTRKRELNGLKEPSLFNKRIQLSSEVKYNIRQETDMEKSAG